MTKITRGAQVKCNANGNMEHPFTGTVSKCYENAALVEISEYDAKDRWNARDLQYRAVISKKAMVVLKAGEPEPEPAVEVADQDALA